MSPELALFTIQQALITSMYLAGPLLLTALVVGSVVSILQAVTQVQEVTLVFVPKIISVAAVMAIAGGWMIQIMVAFGTQSFLSISETGGP